jgi:hypothetical protein
MFEPVGPPLGFARRTTPLLRLLVEQYRQTLPEAELRSLIDFLRERFEHDTALLAATPAGPARAHLLHQLVDAEMAKLPAELEVTCARGCGACCHLEVQISASEAQLLAERVAAGHPIDRARLREQASRPDRSDAWQAGVVAANRCVFLDGGDGCSIYHERPATCRKHLVTTPASLCADPRAHPRPVVVPLADVLLSAALSLEDEPPASIARALARALPDDDPI